jgi:DNA replication protein DnaC
LIQERTSIEQQKSSELYKCSKCKDTYWIVEGNDCKRCECFELNEAERMFYKSGIKDDSYTFTNFQEWNDSSRKLKLVALEYFKCFDRIKNEKQNSIAFLGQVGSGKTHLTVALGLNILKSKRISVVYFNYREVVTELKQNMLDEEFYKKQLSKYQNAKVLLIDDLLKGKTTDSDKNIMFEIINFRYINHLPIIVSSEYDVNALLNFDEAIGSRIYEMCKNYLVEIPKEIANNFRLKQ